MKPLMSSFLFLILACASASAAQAKTFTAKKWGQDVSTALENGNSKKLASLLKRKDIFNSLFVKTGTTEKQTMREARELFEQGNFDAAIQKYDKIEKGSDYWLEASEEKGWAFHRKGSYEKALAQTKTLLSPQFISIVGAEPFFLRSLSQLRICDYKGIFETHAQFKTSQKQRMVELQNIAENTTVPKIDLLVQKINTFPMTFEEVGEDTKLLPRLFYRDMELQKALFVMKLAQISLSFQTLDIDSKKMLKLRNSLVSELTAEAKLAEVVAQKRLIKLAEVETEENAEILKKINLIEVETIQRVHTDQELSKKLYAKGKFKKESKDELVFDDDGHPWVDELDKYEVQVNACPQNVRRIM